MLNAKYGVLMAVLCVTSLAGCSSPAKRMAECEAQGVSKDTCYLAEQNRQAQLNAVYEKQALENAANAVQHAQTAHKSAVKHWQGIKLVITTAGLTADGKPGAVTETNNDATVYQQGAFSYIVYSNGKIAVLDDKGVFQGYAK